jgi:hypothetical protein
MRLRVISLIPISYHGFSNWSMPTTTWMSCWTQLLIPPTFSNQEVVYYSWFLALSCLEWVIANRRGNWLGGDCRSMVGITRSFDWDSNVVYRRTRVNDWSLVGIYNVSVMFFLGLPSKNPSPITAHTIFHYPLQIAKSLIFGERNTRPDRE